ncbi:hypothetical protein ACVIQT_002081 [Bradyrhizobium diazoefficiens]
MPCRLIRNLCTAIVCFAALCGMCAADDFQLVYPDNNVSSRPVLEFRARKPTLTTVSGGQSAGHTFVFLGRELDNGTTFFYGAAGFNPKTGTIRNVLLGPGKTSFDLDDLKNDRVFRVNITEEQEGDVRYIIKNWETKTYSIGWQNCVSLQRDIARAIGLAVPEFTPANVEAEFPDTFVAGLQNLNFKDTPVKQAGSDEQRVSAVRNERATELQGIQKSRDAAAKKWEQRRTDAQRDRERRLNQQQAQPRPQQPAPFEMRMSPQVIDQGTPNNRK